MVALKQYKEAQLLPYVSSSPIVNISIVFGFLNNIHCVFLSISILNICGILLPKLLDKTPVHQRVRVAQSPLG
jgi:hypothetical protein